MLDYDMASQIRQEIRWCNSACEDLDVWATYIIQNKLDMIIARECV